MRTDPRTAELRAYERERKEGRDPFAPAFDAGVRDGANGRLYRDSFRRGCHDPDVYSRGWEYARAAKLEGVKP
jgi:hypothetical protein